MLVTEFEKTAQVPFRSLLEFERISDRQKIAKKIAKLHKEGALSREQLWLGSYFKKEITSGYIPDLIFRYIDFGVGWGVFAGKDFRPGEFIAEYTGKVRKRKRKDRKNAYSFEYLLTPEEESSFIIDAQDQGGVARYINHSEKGNLTPKLATLDGITHVILMTNQPISKGTQLCYDYGPDYWSRRNSPKSLLD